MNFLKQNINSDAFIKCWLVFVLGFLAFQHPIPVCLLLGLVGGTMGGALAQWWGLTQPLERPQSENTPRIPKAMEVVRKRLQSLGWEGRFKPSNRSWQARPRWFSQPRYSRQRRSRRRPKDAEPEKSQE